VKHKSLALWTIVVLGLAMVIGSMAVRAISSAAPAANSDFTPVPVPAPRPVSHEVAAGVAEMQAQVITQWAPLSVPAPRPPASAASGRPRITLPDNTGSLAAALGLVTMMLMFLSSWRMVHCRTPQPHAAPCR
jgi:hypothetical protein